MLKTVSFLTKGSLVVAELTSPISTTPSKQEGGESSSVTPRNHRRSTPKPTVQILWQKRFIILCTNTFSDKMNHEENSVSI